MNFVLLTYGRPEKKSQKWKENVKDNFKSQNKFSPFHSYKQTQNITTRWPATPDLRRRLSDEYIYCYICYNMFLGYQLEEQKRQSEAPLALNSSWRDSYLQVQQNPYFLAI